MKKKQALGTSTEGFGFSRPLLADGGEAVASVPPDLKPRTYSGFFSVGRESVLCYCVSCVSLRGVDTRVLREVLLCSSVEGERGNRTVQARGGHTPRAAGAAPAGEIVAIDPNQLSVHTFTFACLFGIRARAAIGGHQLGPIHRHPVISHGIRERPSAGSGPLPSAERSPRTMSECQLSYCSDLAHWWAHLAFGENKYEWGPGFWRPVVPLLQPF